MYWNQNLLSLYKSQSLILRAVNQSIFFLLNTQTVLFLINDDINIIRSIIQWTQKISYAQCELWFQLAKISLFNKKKYINSSFLFARNQDMGLVHQVLYDNLSDDKIISNESLNLISMLKTIKFLLTQKKKSFYLSKECGLN